jgi:hypothetical protein
MQNPFLNHLIASFVNTLAFELTKSKEFIAAVAAARGEAMRDVALEIVEDKVEDLVTGYLEDDKLIERIAGKIVINAKDIEGLDKLVEEVVEESEIIIRAEKIEGLDEHLENFIDNNVTVNLGVIK